MKPLLRAATRTIVEGLVDWPFPRPAAKALVERETDDGAGVEYLFVEQDVPGGHRWVLPGGGIEAGESPRECVAREVREETGLSVTVDGPVATYDFEVPQGPVVATVFRCTDPRGDVTIDENPDAEPIVDVRWVPAAEVERLTVPEDLRPVLDRCC